MSPLRRATAALLFFTMACYQYVPAAGPSLPAVGRDVRVEVTEEGARRLQLGEVLPETPRTVEGRVVTSDEDGIEIRVPVRDPSRGGFRERDIFQQVQIRTAEIQRIDLRQIDRGWTGIAAAGGLAALVALIVSGFGGWVGGDTAPSPPEKG